VQSPDQRDGKDVGTCWSQQDGSRNLTLLDLLLFFHEAYAVPVDRVRDLMAERPGQLLGV
jgi:hypothetical protein